MSAERANQDVYGLLKDGVKVTVQQGDGSSDVERVRVIDWREPENNDYLLASQFWVSGEIYKRRCDLVGFVNGIPLVLVELKATHKKLENAYKDNLRDYREAIPELFWFNAFVVLSNGSATRVGSTFAPWEHFAEWKRINDEGEQGVVSLETVIRGTCDPSRLLDVVENFVVFEEARGGLIKILAKNHQYLGVNKTIEAVGSLGENRGRVGVFWHTQGSGKSVSMAFLSQKILRTIPGNWTFVVVTDRRELDDQIYKSFAAWGAVTEAQAQAEGSADLRRLLGEDHRYVFTLIQKFRTEPGEAHPVLSERDDVIVIADEAHRTQYDSFALNMRTALPNAAFLGFTGTPLIVGEERTKEVFGDYVSTYDFRQSREDGATVPLYYENRIPELELTNEDLNDELYAVVEEAVLDEAQEAKLQRELSRQYHLITREDRLDTVAKDIVEHFMGRGYPGKAMVVCIDKATAVRMHDKVTAHWKSRLDGLRERLPTASPHERAALEADIGLMEETDMAVVVSQSQNEVGEMAEKSLEIAPHRRRMLDEDLDTKFKDPGDPFRIVFVCAMWMTGFDVPSCSTIYLDKPMRNHTLMQTIARANRVTQDKPAGLIVDYVGILRDLEKALAIYAPTSGGDEKPIQSKDELRALLQTTITDALGFLGEHEIRPDKIEQAEGFDRIALIDDAVDKLVADDGTKRRYLLLASNATKLYRAILPDPDASQYAPTHALLTVLAEKIRSLNPSVDISEVIGRIGTILDSSITARGYEKAEPEELLDLSEIDFEQLQLNFTSRRKRIEIEKLRAQIERKLAGMVQLNRTRADYLEKFSSLISQYNAGSLNVEQIFRELVELAKRLTEEETRATRENLSEEELALFDLLTKPVPDLSDKEQTEVKSVARSLLETLKRERLVLDWRKRQQTRQAVRLSIEQTLDQLPATYTTDLYRHKCDLTYHWVFDSYHGEGKSIYTTTGAV